MRAAQTGDSAAYVKLLHDLTPRIRRIIARQRGFVGAAEVEDLLPDVLLSLHAVRATYDSSRPFMPHANNGVTLMWHGATIGVLVALAAVTGHLTLRWDVRGLPSPATGAQQ